MKTLDEFVNAIVAVLQERYPDDGFYAKTIDGIPFIVNGSAEHVGADLRRLYSSCDGQHLQEIAESIHENFEKDVKDISSLLVPVNTEAVMDAVILKVIGKSTNVRNRENLVTRDFLDLEVCLAVECGSGVFTMTKQLLDNLDVSEDDLYKRAYENTRLSFSKVFSLNSMLPVDDITNFMYVKTTKNRFLGASAILYTDWMRSLANKIGGDFYILPSSTHEILLLAGKELQEATDTIVKMIEEVNNNEVDDTELLSYSLYKYSRENDCVEIVKEVKYDTEG